MPKVNNQSPNTFNVRTRGVPATPTNQYRPANIASKMPPELREVGAEIDNILRLTTDKQQEIRDIWTPAMLYVSGNTTDAPIDVLEEPGSSLGLSLTLNRPGSWVVSACVCINIVGDTDPFTLFLSIAGVKQALFGQWQQSTDGIVMLQQQWQIGSQGTENLTLILQKATGSAGNSTVTLGNTSFSATWQGGG